jgi:hypothetical protein
VSDFAVVTFVATRFDGLPPLPAGISLLSLISKSSLVWEIAFVTQYSWHPLDGLLFPIALKHQRQTLSASF